MNTAVPVLFVVAALFATPALFVCCIVLVVKIARLVVHDDPPRPTPAAAAARRRAPSDRGLDAEPAALAVWRYRRLLELELEPVTAAGAALAAVDVASVRALVDGGCPPDLAVSIVARDTDI